MCAVVCLFIALLLEREFKKNKNKKIFQNLFGTFKMQKLIIMMEVTMKFIKILRGEFTDWDILTFRMTQDKLQNTADIFSWRSSRTSFPLLFAIMLSSFSRQQDERAHCKSANIKQIESRPSASCL